MKKLKNSSGIGVVEILMLIVALIAIVSIAQVAFAQTIPSDGISSPLLSCYPASVETIDDTNYYITEDDIAILASAIFYEEGEPETPEDERRCYLAGSVVINRMASPEFPDTVGGVIDQTGQYACRDMVFNEGYYGDIDWEIAEELLTYGTTIPNDVVFQAQFSQGSGIYEHIGNQYFCYR